MTKSKTKRQAERAALYEEHQAIIAARKKWIAEHPDVAGKPAGERPWGASPEAPRGASWWGVKRMGPYGNVSHRRMFRHASRASAEREAQFLAETFPGAVFVVLEAVACFVTGTPEVALGTEAALETMERAA